MTNFWNGARKHYCNVYGTHIIETLNNLNIYKWDITILNGTPFGCPRIVIGIASQMMSNFQEQPFSLDTSCESYYCTKNGRAIELKTGDMITMELDLRMRKFGFFKDDEYNLVSSNVKIKDGINYRLAISLCNEQESVCINNFYTIYQD